MTMITEPSGSVEPPVGPSPAPRSDRFVLVSVLALELLFILLTRVIFRYSPDNFVVSELLRTGLRLILVAAYLVLAPGILKHQTTGESFRQPLLIVAALVFLSIPLLVGFGGGVDMATRMVFAVTSIAVALREELAYRALLQNLLTKRFGTGKAVAMTALLFVCMHLGVVQASWSNYAGIGLASVFFGILYARTRNIWLVIVLHASYDAFWCLPQLMSIPISPVYVPVMMGVAVLLSLRYIAAPDRALVGRRP